MEKVYCPRHRDLCLLKTGTNQEKKGFQKNFYMCPMKKKGLCNFSRPAGKEIAVNCEKHRERAVIQLWDKKIPHRIYYMCSQKPKNGLCGYVDIELDKENQNSPKKQAPSSQGQAQSLHPSPTPKASGRAKEADKVVRKTDKVMYVPAPPVWVLDDSSPQAGLGKGTGDAVEVLDGGFATEIPHRYKQKCSELSSKRPPMISSDEEDSDSEVRDDQEEQSEVSGEETNEDQHSKDEELHSEVSDEEKSKVNDEEQDSEVDDEDHYKASDEEEQYSDEKLHFDNEHSQFNEVHTADDSVEYSDSLKEVSSEMETGEDKEEVSQEAETDGSDQDHSRDIDDSEEDTDSLKEVNQQSSEMETGDSEQETETDGSDQDSYAGKFHSEDEVNDEEEHSEVDSDESEADEKVDSLQMSRVDNDREWPEREPSEVSVGEENSETGKADSQQQLDTTVEYSETGSASGGSEEDSESSDQEPSQDSEKEWLPPEPVPKVASPCQTPLQAAAKVTSSSQRTLTQAVPSSSLIPTQVHATVQHLSQPLAAACKPPTQLPPPPAADKPPSKAEATFKVGYQSRKVIQQLHQTEMMIQQMSHKLPDGGAELRRRKKLLYARLDQMKKPRPPMIDLAQMGYGGAVKMVGQKGLTAQARMLTSGTVEQLHASLEACPTMDMQSEDPPQLTVSLMAHQKHALAWMSWRERETPSAGILADDMGLGKTLSMLSLVAKSKLDPQSKEWLRKPPAKPGMVKCGGTLVVCPASLMLQWQQEIESKFKRGSLRVLVYHGQSRTRHAQDFTCYDVVVTTYNIVGIEGASCQDVAGVQQQKAKKKSSFTTLFDAHWRRVILDEAHVIRNHKSGISVGACSLKGDLRWAVTGTPIQNNLKDFFSLVKFIQLAPFDDYRIWKSTVEQKGSVGMTRLNTLVSSLVLRRTKEEMNERKQLKLTNKEVKTHMVQLRQEERDVYHVLFQEAQKVMFKWLEEQGEIRTSPPDRGPVDYSALPDDVARLVNKIMAPYLVGVKGRCVLGLLLRLRQCCCHLNLLTGVLNKAEADHNSLALEVAMSALTLDSQKDEVDAPSPSSQVSIPRLFKKEVISTKIVTVLDELMRIGALKAEPVEKSIIVSQWTSMLNIVQLHLDQAGISHARIDGTVPPKERQKIMELFNSPRRDPTVMLLSLQAGGVGLNLIGANHVFMLDMHWNPALEVQAGDRCHRVGQPRDVVIHKFVTETSVEEKILRLQEKKLMLAKNVLEGASEKTAKNRNKLTLNDLKTLFDMTS